MVTKVKVMQLKNNQILVTIPRALANAKELKKGDDVGWSVNNDGDLVLSKLS